MDSTYKLLQCKKLIKSTKFIKTKLGTLTRTQPKRDLKKKILERARLSHYSRKYDDSFISKCSILRRQE
jgi:hypothetical protein